MDLRKTLQFVHELLDQNKIDHALIGGLALACYGSTRSTVDLDLIIHEQDIAKAKEILLKNAFTLSFETSEVLQFSGLGYVDILVAKRPIAQEILQKANDGGPNGIRFVRMEDLIGLKIQAYSNDASRELQDKADIQFIIEKYHQELSWDTIKKYAELFNKWDEINELRNKIIMG